MRHHTLLQYHVIGAGSLHGIIAPLLSLYHLWRTSQTTANMLRKIVEVVIRRLVIKILSEMDFIKAESAFFHQFVQLLRKE